jgi:DNA-binding CsgD family transcriptional regulator
MPSPSQPEKEGKRKNIGPYDSFYQRPNVVLLGEELWGYIQKHYHMSSRELQVAKLVCRGFSNGDIARELKLKNGTAKTHLRNIYRKIRVRSKIAMLLKIIEQANKVSSGSGITPLIPIVDIKKPVKKPSVPDEIRKK